MKTKQTFAGAGLAAVLAAAGLAGSSFADSHHSGHGQAKESMEGAASPASQAFEAANMDMMAGMEMEYTGDTDVDFARSMIPHHRGAIAMAEVMLEHGEDPALRDLAQEIIAAQEAEIATLEAWLAENAD